jgi:eukaryotic-like serine/threonine-protein kinase
MHPTFGRFELLKRLAGGGMGEVYLARQRGLDGFQKLLVIKTLLPHLCEDEEFITMFKDEARLTGQLIHPNICQVFEFDQVDGTYYIAMEYLRGEDLRRLWKACETRGKPLRVPLICRVIADAAAGLDFAHSLRNQEGEPYHIVHRDISPQNLLVTFEGGVKVIDFGVAKAAGRAQHTRTGALKGKYSYMSPEQVAGQEIDGRTDIFALGIVLHELLTGRRLFKADSDVQTLERVRKANVPPPSSINPQIPQSLDGLVLRALAKDREQRFQTAQEFRLALEEWLIQGRMSASSAHLAEFLKVIYAERLEKEARFGPLLGDAGLSAIPDQLAGKTPGSPASSPSLRTPGQPAVMGSTPAGATSNQRPPEGTRGKEISLSQIATESGAPFERKGSGVQLPVLLGVAAAVLLGTAAMVWKGSRPAPAAAPSQPAAAQLSIETEPAGVQVAVDGRPSGRSPIGNLALRAGPVRLDLTLDGYKPLTDTLLLAAGPQSRRYALEKAAPEQVTIKLETDPPGAEISEGAQVLGKTPKLWTATRGSHVLRFTLPGYQEVTTPVEVAVNDDSKLYRLAKLQKARPQPSAGGLSDIKSER